MSWNLEETKRFIEYLEESNDLRDVMLYIAVNTGLRIGEVYGLAYEDITETTLSVNRGYDYNHTHKFTDAKNEASIRTIAITPKIYSKIIEHKLKNQKHNSKYLFLDSRNKERLSHTALTAYLKQLSELLGNPVITAHSLRHTHCSILLYQGVDINYISKRLGHSSVIETSNTYSHIIDELNQTQNDYTRNILDNLTSVK